MWQIFCVALEHIRKCHVEKESKIQQMERLRARIDELNAAITLCQEKLPASGAPITRQVSGVCGVGVAGMGWVCLGHPLPGR